MLIAKNSTLLMTGDSITDCGRAHPVGEAPRGLGDGYVSLVHALTAAPHSLRVLNTGVGGDTVADLAARWDRDVLSLRPDWLSVMIGVNDVWRWFDPAWRDLHVPLSLFSSTLEELVGRVRPRLKGLVLMSPFYLQPDRADPMRAALDEYGAVVRNIADRHTALFVDTQAAFDALMRELPASALSEDRFHPNQTGHTLLAREFLKTVGFNG